MTTEEEETFPREEEAKPLIEPPFGTPEWILYWGELEGHLPTPINLSITGATMYWCPPLQWFNFDVYPHKIKLTNTGYTLILGAKWMAERPYVIGGPFFEKMIFSQIHFHWGGDFTEGSEHTVDKRRHPAEMQATFFKSEYMTQEQAMYHKDGVVVFSYLIRYGVNPDPRIQRILDGFPRIREAQTNTRIGPYPLSHLMPLFFEDYFIYWGSLHTVHGDSYVVRFLVPRVPLYASFDQMKTFRTLWDPWDEPNLRNFRPLQERQGRHIFLINPHWNLYNSLLPIPRILEPSISTLSPAYTNNPWMLPPQNADMIPKPTEEEDK